MEEDDWTKAIRELSEESNRLGILARCVGVAPELGRWRAGDEVAGMSAADGLDQARAELERLASGGAKALLDLVERIAEVLPAPME